MPPEKIAIISGKGGVGKTSLSANLGSALSHLWDKDVLVIDTDISNSHLGLHLGFHYNPATINTVLSGKHDIEESIYEHETGVKILPGALNYDDAKEVDIYNLEGIMDEFEHLDVILLDCSPGLNRNTTAALRNADKALYVSKPSFSSVIDVARSKSMVEDLGKDSLGVVLNMVKGRGHEVSRDEIEGFTGLDVIGEIPYDENVEKSSAQGIPVTVFDPHCQASRAIEDLAVEILDLDPDKKRTGFFRKIRETLPYL